jgi:hypothetical protein
MAVRFLPSDTSDRDIQEITGTGVNAVPTSINTIKWPTKSEEIKF